MGGLLAVFVGAGLGGVLRHGVNVGAARLVGSSPPIGTVIVNVVGSLAMGLVAGYFLLRPGSSQVTRLFLTTGVLGGFTTFSAFSLDFAVLWNRGEPLTAIGYALGSVLLSLLAIFIGLAAIRGIA